MNKCIQEGIEQERYFGAILEDIRDKFQIIVELVKKNPNIEKKTIQLEGLGAEDEIISFVWHTKKIIF